MKSKSNKTVDNLIKTFDLKAHTEGGFYKETYSSSQRLNIADIGDRNLTTAIFYLLQGSDFSSFHRIKSDEIWQFYQGEE